MSKKFNKRESANTATKNTNELRGLGNLLQSEHRLSVNVNPPVAEQDGKRFIDIGRGASTDLGLGLHTGTPLRFNDSIYGEFACIDTLIAYISATTKEWTAKNINALEDFRRIKMGHCIRLATQNGLNLNRDIPNKDYHTARALWARIKTNKVLKDEVVACSLQFAFYVKSQFGDSLFVPRGVAYLGRAVMSMRECIINGEEYNPDYLVENREALALQFEDISDKASRALDALMEERVMYSKDPKAPVAQDYEEETQSPLKMALVAENGGGLGVAESYDPDTGVAFTATPEQLAHAANVLEAQASGNEA